MKSIDSLVKKVLELKKNGLSEKEISTELHLSVDTVTWLMTRNVKEEKPPADVKIGWRSVGVFGDRIGLISSLFSDIIVEEMEDRDFDRLDTAVGIAINGIPYATMVSEELGIELSIYRPPVTNDGRGTFSSNYATPKNKNVVIIDDVVSTGHSAKCAIADIKKEGGNPILVVVTVNKTPRNDLDEVPMRALIRARTIA